MMAFGIPSDLTFYKLIKEQGSVLAGVLAFGGGSLAYCAGRRQARAVEVQTRELQQSERRRLSREILIAIALIDGLLAEAQRGIDAISTFDTGPRQLGEGVTNSIRKNLPALALDPVFDQIGRLDREIIDACFDLRAKIDRFRTQIIGVSMPATALSQELRDIQLRMKSLRSNLRQAALAAQALVPEDGGKQK